MAISFGLIEEKSKSIRVKRGRKSFFTPEGKIALAFLKMYIGLSAPELMEALNGNIHYQIFCGIRISPENQLTNYQLIDSIMLELSQKLKIQEQQKLLAAAWKPYMKNATKRELARESNSDGRLIRHAEGALRIAKDSSEVKTTEIVLIFFGIHTANVVNLARRESVEVALAA